MSLRQKCSISGCNVFRALRSRVLKDGAKELYVGRVETTIGIQKVLNYLSLG